MPRGKGQGGASMVGKHPFYHVPSTTKECDLGQRYEDDFGRVFYYAKGGVAIPMYAGTDDGNLVCAPADLITSDIIATAFGEDASTAPASGQGGSIGDTLIRVNAVDAAQDANEAEGGFLYITDATGEGFYYPIVAHDAFTTSATSTSDITIAEPGLIVALDNSSVGLIMKSPYNGVVEMADDVQGTAVVVGAILKPTTATGQYCWLQTWGWGIARSDSGAFVANQGIVSSTAGGYQGQVMETFDDMGVAGGLVLGLAIGGAATNVWAPVFWKIHH